MRVMGIDPGSRITGYGVIDVAQEGGLSLVAMGAVRTRPRIDFQQRLKQIYDGIFETVRERHPEQVAFEDSFYSRNVKTALQLGQARGAAVLAALNQECPVYSYSPREVKQSLTGYGGASKEQIQAMVVQLLKLSEPPSPLDISDALAIAICHAFRSSSPLHRFRTS